jgi:membrane complex biogenesis BtpA family protein
MDTATRFDTDSPLVGMVHLPPLPGAPDYAGDRERIRERAVADAEALAAGGVDGLIVENYGDTPFYPESVPAHVVAEMTAAVRAVREAVEIPVGVNVLRNDAGAALSVAAAAGGAFVRVNVHTGAAVTDQGVIEGQAHETVRLREEIDADVAILADVAVKHAASLGDRSPRTQVADAIERGHADGIVVSGPATGEATPDDAVEAAVAARDAVDPSVPVFVGSGVTVETVGETLARADGAIVGTALKRDGETTAPVDRDRVERLVAAAGE